jgi:hypothetical protein
MVAVAVVCPACRRVLALGAGLPAVCFGGIPPDQRGALTPAQLDADPRAHTDCIELEVAVPDDLEPTEQLAEVERTYGPQLAALGELARQMEPEK